MTGRQTSRNKRAKVCPSENFSKYAISNKVINEHKIISQGTKLLQVNQTRRKPKNKRTNIKTKKDKSYADIAKCSGAVIYRELEIPFTGSPYSTLLGLGFPTNRTSSLS